MEPLALHIHEVPGVGLGADGEAGDVRRRAEELHRSGVGAAGGFQLPGVGREGLGDAGDLALLVGQQGADVVVEVFYPFPVCGQRPRMVKGRLDEVQGRLVVLRHFGGHGEVVQVLPVVGEVPRHMMLIPQHPFHPPDQVLHRAVVLLGHHSVGGGGFAGAVHDSLADRIVERTVIDSGEHAGVGLLAEVLPAPVVHADGVGFRLRGFRRLGGDGQQGRGHGSGQEQGHDFFAFHARFLRFHSMVGFLQTEPYHMGRGKSNTIGRQRGDLTNSVIPARRSRTSGSPAGSSRRCRE